MNETHFSKTNYISFSYFSFCLIGLLVDYVCTIRYYSQNHLNQLIIEFECASHILSGIVLLFFLVLGSIFIYKYHLLKLFPKFTCPPSYEKIDWLIIGVIILLTMMRLPIPDSSYDTINYHLFLQSPLLSNNVLVNFFPSGIQTFTFPLSDHLFYYFRSIFGYRGGVILNSLVLIIIYFQVKEILLQNNAARKFFTRKPSMLGIISIFILSTEFIFANIGIYMVDILPVPFLLEMYKIATGERKDPRFVVFYTTLLAGFSISLKLLMAIYCIPLLLIIYIRYYKSISLRSILLICILGISPSIPYLLHNFTQTNNPLFPFLNSIFHSPYFPESNWKDGRWGSNNFLETIIWPVLIYFNPKRASELGVYSGRMSLGYIVCIFLIFICFVKRKNEIFLQTFIFMISILLWITNMGYVRYGSYLEIISGILIFESVTILLQSNDKMHIVFSGVICTFVALQLISAYSYTITNKSDWSGRLTVFQNPQYYVTNVKKIFTDYQPIIYTEDSEKIEQILESIDCWIVLPDDFNSGIVSILRDDIPIVNIGYSNLTKGTQNVFYNYFKTSGKNMKDIFLISARSDTDIINDLDQIGLKIVKNNKIQLSFFSPGQPLSLIMVTSK